MSRYLPGNVVGMFQSFVSQRQRHPLQSQEHVHHKLFHHPQNVYENQQTLRHEIIMV